MGIVSIAPMTAGGADRYFNQGADKYYNNDAMSEIHGSFKGNLAQKWGLSDYDRETFYNLLAGSSPDGKE